MQTSQVVSNIISWSVGLCILMLGTASHADSFRPGDIVVYRVGDGEEALAGTGSAVFVDEYTPSGTLIQSVALPTVASGSNNPLIASGTATSEGLLTLSADSQYILLTGYDSTIPAVGDLSGTAAATLPRTVGRVGFDGSVDTSTALTDFADANNPRGAASTDGINLWVGGAAGGVRYTTLGSTTSTQLSTDSKNARAVGIFDGQLYMSSQKTNIRVATVGTGLPTTAGQSITNLPNIPSGILPDAFFFADLDGSPGIDTLYVADDTTGNGQIQKYSLVGGIWIGSGVIEADTVHGVTGVVTGQAVTLYATSSGTSGTNGTLYVFTDTSGYNGDVSGAATVLVTAVANEAFRGVAMAPAAAVAATPTATPAPTPTPTLVLCVGDCNGDGTVTVDEILLAVNMALTGASPAIACPSLDANNDGAVTIDEILAAVSNALAGCAGPAAGELR